jgi:hypothetical protein
MQTEEQIIEMLSREVTTTYLAAKDNRGGSFLLVKVIDENRYKLISYHNVCGHEINAFVKVFNDPHEVSSILLKKKFTRDNIYKQLEEVKKEDFSSMERIVNHYLLLS